MLNYSTVLVQNTWGVHLNFEGHLSSPPSCPDWLTQLQQQDWQRRGIVVWDVDLRIVTHLYVGYALELLEHLQDNDAWKTKGLVVGSPLSNSPQVLQATHQRRLEDVGYWKIKWNFVQIKYKISLNF